MLFQLFKFECFYQFRQLSWWLALLLFTVFGYLLSGRVVSSGNVQILSPQNISYALLILTQLAIFTTTLVTANSVLRDIHYDFFSFVNTKPVSHKKLLLSRFFGLYTMSLLIIFSALLALILPMYVQTLDAEIFGTLALKNILWPFVIFVVPNMFFTCSILFFSACILRTTMWTYFAGIAIYVFYNISAALLDSPAFTASSPLSEEKLKLASLFDPFAISAFLEQTMLWTSNERNTQLVNFEGPLLLNRLLWLLISCVLLIIAIKWKKQSIGKSTKQRKVKKVKKVKKVNKAKVSNLVDTQVLASTDESKDKPALRQQTVHSKWLAFKIDALLELRMTLRSAPFIALMVLTAVMVLLQLVSAISMGAMVGERYPYTSLLLPHLANALEVIGLLIVVFYSGEMVWRAREYNFQGVLNCTPSARWIYFLSKVTVMAMLILIMLSVAVFVAISYQLWHGFYAEDLSLFFSIIPLYALPLLMLSILCISVQVIVGNKFVGFILCAILMAVFATNIALNILGYNVPEHNLLRFSSLGSIRYSDFTGFDFFLKNITWFLLYWSFVTVTVAIFSYGVSKRTSDESVISAIKRLPFYLSKKGTVAISTSILLSALCGGYIFYNTNVINQYETLATTEHFQVNYEKTYIDYSQKNSPKITDVYSEVDFYPSNHRVDINGFYWLENQSNNDISTFIITLPNADQTFSFNLDKASSVIKNEALDVYEVTFDQALKSGQRVKLEFTSSLAKKGFKNKDENVSLLENGSYFHNESLFPYIGYKQSFEIKDKLLREQYGLGEQESVTLLKPSQQYSVHSLENDAEWVNFETIVSTQKDQVAVATGELESHWTIKERNYYHYKVGHKIANFFAFSSARYQVQNKQIDNVLVKVYYHPSHDRNIQSILTTAKASLTYYQQQFGPYPFKELNLVEIPYRGFARAYSATVFFSENVGFKENLNSTDNIDDLSNIVAHEIAHQWWGHQLTAADTEGAMLLIESLADYSALMVMKKLYGEDYIARMTEKATRKYLQGRNSDSIGETSLHKMLGQHYLRYEKGPVIYNALRLLIGEDKLNQSLRNLLKEKAFATTDYATSYDLIKHIQLVAGNSFDPLIKEWLMQVSVYDLSIEDTKMVKNASGKYQVTATLLGKKLPFEQNKDDKEIAFQHHVPVAIYSKKSGKHYILKQFDVQLIKGKKQLSILLDEEPSKIVIDPNFMFIDRNKTDNTTFISKSS